MLTEVDFKAAAARLDVPVAAVKAVCEVEAPRGGFNPDGTPVTLFEGHWFYRLTLGKYATTHPTICYPKWDRQFYGKTWQAEQARLNEAMALDRLAAIKSASWGRFQIMGFNYTYAGFGSVNGFHDAMCESEAAQLMAFVSFVKSQGLSETLRRKDWAGFALRYNGTGYRVNKYDTKLAKAFERYSA